MKDRGIIKWKPFDSCFSSFKILNEVNKEKEKENIPILSEDQISVIENKIIEAYNLKEIVTIEFYFNGYIKKAKGIIYNINENQKKIYLNNNTLYFKQILKIY